MSDCIFCKIIHGEIPSTKIYEDDEFYAFKDLNPQAPVHFLVVPKKHITSLMELEESDSPLVVDDSSLGESLVGPCDCVGIDPYLGSEFPYGRYSVLGGEFADEYPFAERIGYLEINGSVAVKFHNINVSRF